MGTLSPNPWQGHRPCTLLRFAPVSSDYVRANHVRPQIDDWIDRWGGGLLLLRFAPVLSDYVRANHVRPQIDDWIDR